jgi:hypothetical protein
MSSWPTVKLGIVIIINDRIILNILLYIRKIMDGARTPNKAREEV